MRENSTGLGIAIKIASTCCMAVMFSVVKFVSPRLPAGEIVFIRSAVSMLFIMAIIACGREGLRSLRTPNIKGHLARSIMGAASMFLMFVAISIMPLAGASAISFTTPIMITLLAVLVLREVVGVVRWLAVGLGITGILVITWEQLNLSASGSNVPLGVVAALCSAILAAAAAIALRTIAQTERPDRIAFYFMLIATVMGLATFPFGWVWPDTQDTLLLLMAGLVGGVGQYLMSLSYRYSQASVLAPFDYLNLLWLTLIGAFVFEEAIGLPFYIGAALIVTGGMMVTVESRRRSVR